MIGIGDQAPGFTLPDTGGAERSLETPAVVVFTCNHCPYALAWHDRIADAARDYEGVHFYAINPNDAERYPRDSFEAMRERVERRGRLADAVSPRRVAGGGARVRRQDDTRTCSWSTPTVRCATAARRIADHGDPTLNASWLREALDAVVAGEEVARPETDPVGCSVKWK